MVRGMTFRREHIAIGNEEYVAGTKTRPEVGFFAQKHVTRRPDSSGQIGAGETVWMKWASGPVVPHAVVKSFAEFDSCTAALRKAVKRDKLYDRTDYWESLAGQPFSAMAIFLEREEWLPEPIEPKRRSRGASWVVLSTIAEHQEWLPAGASPIPPRTCAMSNALRFTILQRDRFKCVYCGGRRPEMRLVVDHLTPYSRGGENYS
jgi:hypothetical protein